MESEPDQQVGGRRGRVGSSGRSRFRLAARRQGRRFGFLGHSYEDTDLRLKNRFGER